MGTSRGLARAGSIGVPGDGVDMKLATVGEKLEARFRGPNITPGYWRQPELTRAAFDEEGYYRTGDAMRFVDAADPQQGLGFDGRTAEDFKLGSGTWVSVGPLRARFNSACTPYVQDVVITGHDRDSVGALVFPNVEACRALCPEMARTAPASEVLGHAAVRAKFTELLGALALAAAGSSTRIERALLLDVPPSIDAGEITDKGSINQAAVLKARAALVAKLYATPRPARIIVVERK
jgi:feruloyl-CoA synthase